VNHMRASSEALISKVLRMTRKQFVLTLFLLIVAWPAFGQNWQWTIEAVDPDGKSTSLAVDKDGNVHLSYFSAGVVKYAFRPAQNAHWFTMDIAPGGGYADLPTKIALDPHGNPHICFTPAVLKFASFDGKQWGIQQIDPGSGLIEYSCSISFAPDGIPSVTWYQYSAPDGGYYLHMKHAVLKNGVWMARTVDYEGQTGKWNSVAVDAQGVPHVSYDSFLAGAMKYATWDGKQWSVSVVDSRDLHHGATYNVGMGNSLILNGAGKAGISYEDLETLRYAWQTDTGWRIDVVDHIRTSGRWLGYRSRLAIDPQGNPHIAYEDSGAVKHAYWDGSRWKVQIISPVGSERDRFEDIGIDQQGTIYISYRDALDGSLKVSVGRPQAADQKTVVNKTGH
jgi:hypothetical protein